jgi:hypothetical protein
LSSASSRELWKYSRRSALAISREGAAFISVLRIEQPVRNIGWLDGLSIAKSRTTGKLMPEKRF